MAATRKRSDSKQADSRVLETAAQLILERGSKDVDISELSRRARTKRTTIYAIFGKAEQDSVKSAIYRTIINEFLAKAGTSIQHALAVVDQTAPTPGAELAAILRATLLAFANNQLFGKVLLQQLNLRNPEENILVRQIFGEVENIINKARKLKPPHLSQAGLELSDWKIRQIIFGLTRSLLRTLYLDQFDSTGKPVDKPALTQDELEMEVLRVLTLYCSEESLDAIQTTIDALKKKQETPTKSRK